MSRRFVLIALACLPAATALAQTGPWYVRGNYYCRDGISGAGPDGRCWGWDSVNVMYDDGLHGDGEAGDGVFGATIACTEPGGRLEFKIATSDWSVAVPSVPCCPLSNAVLFASGPDDSIHFTLDTNGYFDEWVPWLNIVTCDHALPDGAVLELIGSAPETGAWTTGVPANHVGSRWQRIVTIAAPGIYELKFRVQGTWEVANFGYDYNNTDGRNVAFTTTLTEADVLFQLDLATGRIRVVELGQMPVRSTSWGRLKATYR